jgi:large subunit ribosomal protein L29
VKVVAELAKGVTAEDLRTQPEQELVTKLKEAKEELFNLRFQAATGQLESHGRLRAVKREIARIYTVMRERELGIITFVEDELPATAADEAGEVDEAGEIGDADDVGEVDEAPAATAPKAKKASKKATKATAEDSADSAADSAKESDG